MRHSLRLRPRAKLDAEERDGGIFLRPAVRPKKAEPIAYLPPGALKLTQRECEMMDALAGEDAAPDFS
jgi:hypothetical protein